MNTLVVIYVKLFVFTNTSTIEPRFPEIISGVLSCPNSRKFVLNKITYETSQRMCLNALFNKKNAYFKFKNTKVILFITLYGIRTQKNTEYLMKLKHSNLGTPTLTTETCLLIWGNCLRFVVVSLFF